ncbi:zona pellucida sperm-binding protein 3d.2 [Brachionichthys hirsutus]|uniref:zona pellucida sperm-binding protein 3d.2 n=1 Tax=Brachionichthys hirsutus TaxID=412623 RepID=UPI00360536FC
MFSFSLFVSLLLMSPADGRTRPTPESVSPPPPPLLHLPVFVDSRLPPVEKKYFSPAPATGPETLPEPLLKVLFPIRPSTSPPGASGVSVNISCSVNDMLVEVQKSVLDSGEMNSRIKLGTCQSSRSTEDYLYFEYGLNMCGTIRELTNHQMVYRNTLHYAPRLQGPIRRAAPFSLPVECYYNRYHNSYKIGYTPKTRMRQIFKPTRNKAKFILTPRNARWERLSPSQHYTLGTPMYFEAEALSMSQDKRLYVHSCHVTPEESPASAPQSPIVTNFGCMLKSRASRSRFVPYKPNIVRFTLDAFVFTGMTDQLFMHCSMSVNGSAPTAIAKSCNYNRKARRWVELYGSDSVCSCCDSKCSFAASTATVIISSRMASPVTTTRAEDARPSGDLAKRRTTSPPEERLVEGSERPLGGGGAALVEKEGEEQRVKGSAVVEAEQDAPPRIIFEDIFEFD